MIKKTAPKDGKEKKDDPEQSQRFVETAERANAEKTGKSFKSALNQIFSEKKNLPPKP